MVTEQLRSLYQARPFHPFTIHVADGDKIPVKSPKFMWMTPGERTVFVSQGDEEVAILDLLVVTKLSVANGSGLPSGPSTDAANS